MAYDRNIPISEVILSFFNCAVRNLFCRFRKIFKKVLTNFQKRV